MPELIDTIERLMNVGLTPIAFIIIFLKRILPNDTIRPSDIGPTTHVS